MVGSSSPRPDVLASEARFHALDERSIAGAIRATAPGNFLLGYFDGSSFQAFYVGRSDSDVGASLQSWVDAPSRPRRERGSPHWRPRSVSLPRYGSRPSSQVTFGIDTGYTHFAFRYASTATAAFERECRDYHALGGSERLDNDAHPRPPIDSPCGCPMHG